MTSEALEVCRAILRRTDPTQEFTLEENFDSYARGYPEPALVPEGRFEGTVATLFVTILVPFVVDVFKAGAKDVLKETLKRYLIRLFKDKETLRQEEIAQLRDHLEKVLSKTKLPVRERERLRNKLNGALDSISQHPPAK